MLKSPLKSQLWKKTTIPLTHTMLHQTTTIPCYTKQPPYCVLHQTTTIPCYTKQPPYRATPNNQVNGRLSGLVMCGCIYIQPTHPWALCTLTEPQDADPARGPEPRDADPARGPEPRDADPARGPTVVQGGGDAGQEGREAVMQQPGLSVCYCHSYCSSRCPRCASSSRNHWV